MKVAWRELFTFRLSLTFIDSTENKPLNKYFLNFIMLTVEVANSSTGLVQD